MRGVYLRHKKRGARRVRQVDGPDRHLSLDCREYCHIWLVLVSADSRRANNRSHLPARRDLDFRRVALVLSVLPLAVLALAVLVLPTLAFAATIS